MDQAYRHLLTKQGYAFSGEHSAIKVCEWTKKSLRGKGVCYKEKFYGINAHRCVQMTPVVNMCSMDCVYCWRERNESGFGEKIDPPDKVIENSIKAHIHKLQGFKGSDSSDKSKVKDMEAPLHFAISLTGEPTLYPHLPEFIKSLHNQGISSFLVTNGQFPEALERLDKENALPTQLYLSFDHPDKETFLKLDRPDLKDGWDRLMRSLSFLKQVKHKTRTTLRITLVKGLNDTNPEGFAKILELSDPWFIELKSYMYVGASRNRLTIDRMPYHKDIVEFAGQISKYSDYKIIDEQPQSRVVLMMRQDHPNRIMHFDGKETRFLME